ncbi:CHRD domain-containing protein [Herbidospora cretacea]|uniref:CHRD domain-containing protein n=1 Tax=Herbidospora cretacea TaxID=28444 RepID=UPI0007731E51|nr:CHRD domain-containing protein [Herbidospora cretacea]
MTIGAVTATPSTAATRSLTVSSTVSSGGSHYYSATLLGRNEVREPGKKVNDRDGLAVAKFRISGSRLYFIVRWKKTAKPTAFHIHKGKAGVNGPVVIDLLSNGHIHGNTATGSVSVKSSLLKQIKSKPKNWYANLHTAQFPDGAVRGQLHSGPRW